MVLKENYDDYTKKGEDFRFTPSRIRNIIAHCEKEYGKTQYKSRDDKHLYLDIDNGAFTLNLEIISDKNTNVKVIYHSDDPHCKGFTDKIDYEWITNLEELYYYIIDSYADYVYI